MLQALEQTGRPLSELWQPFSRYARSGEINRRVDDVGAAVERARSAFSDGEADELDGLTVQFASWWFNLRPSNTEPLLRLNVEATDEDELARRSAQILELIGGDPAG